MKHCPFCGAKLSRQGRFCLSCGKDTEQISSAGSGVPAAAGNPAGTEMPLCRETMLGRRAEAYIGKFDKLEAQHTSVSWNWCAFLFPVQWMAYRKMYLPAVSIYIVTCIPVLSALVYYFYLAEDISLQTAMGLLENMSHRANIFSAFTHLSIAVVAGMFADNLYKGVIGRRIARARSLRGADRERYIKRASGTSLWAVLWVSYVPPVIFWGLTALLLFVWRLLSS